MGSKNIARVEFDTVLAGLDVCIGFSRITKFGRENYGADADGNRGMMIDTIDEDEYAQISVEWEDVAGGKHVFPAEALPAGLGIGVVSEAVETYMEKHVPEPAEEPERDYDDQDEDE